ncbi:hypothetical protein ACFOQM_06085 [Paenibacillus sp. GCM10012307]|uniref:Uncharacterized protein n=1 Tax=Paenibacillus roseus TaxID=2798579 RepID=A0A934MU99_9BACL|nr:hypothetical protein [Paenibacillus roseus]MBJ6360867.1 hypothetical protein [Paenibacillus roseus]
MSKTKPETETEQQEQHKEQQSGAPEGTANSEIPEVQVPTVRVEFLTNVKHDNEFYRAGQREDLQEDVFLTLNAAKAVRRLGE